MPNINNLKEAQKLLELYFHSANKKQEWISLKIRRNQLYDLLILLTDHVTIDNYIRGAIEIDQQS